MYDDDLHAKRVLSLANATLGALVSASLAIHAVGRGLAQAMGTLTKHGVKQVDRLLSNRGVDEWTSFEYWTPYVVGVRTEVVVAVDWTSFAADEQDTSVLAMVTGHGRATPLLWKTVASSTLRGNQRRYEYELIGSIAGRDAGVKVTVLADRGFADCKLFYVLATELGFEYVTLPPRVLIQYYGKRWGSRRAFGISSTCASEWVCRRCMFRARNGGTACCWSARWRLRCCHCWVRRASASGTTVG